MGAMHKTLSFVHVETTRCWIPSLHAVVHCMKEGYWITEKFRDMHKGNSFDGARLCWLLKTEKQLSTAGAMNDAIRFPSAPS